MCRVPVLLTACSGSARLGSGSAVPEAGPSSHEPVSWVFSRLGPQTAKSAAEETHGDHPVTRQRGQPPGIQFPGWFWVPGTHLEIELDSPFHLSQAPRLWALLTMHDVLSRST